jgi:hypothetical protein
VARVVPAGSGASRSADATFRVHADKDDAAVVVASGGTSPDASSAAPSAFAMTGAVWIDADGDGHALGR